MPDILLITLTVTSCSLSEPDRCETFRFQVEPRQCAEYTVPNPVVYPGEGWAFRGADCGGMA
ncbi:hypothetical protein [Halovulum sp. GXIMD14793]